MGAPKLPQAPAAPRPADTARARLDAMAYAETQKKLRESRGRRSAFMTTQATPAESKNLGGTAPKPRTTLLGL